MHFLENYYRKKIKYDLINKFQFENIGNILKLKKIILNFNCKSSEIKYLAPISLFLELISEKTTKGIIITKTAITVLRLRKGNPIGCKITLKKDLMYRFLTRLIVEIFPKIENFEKEILNPRNIISINSISYNIKKLSVFPELENYYFVFSKKLPSLNITLITNTKAKSEIKFLFDSFKIPISL